MRSVCCWLPEKNLHIPHCPLKVTDRKIQFYIPNIHNQTFFFPHHNSMRILRSIATQRTTWLGFLPQYCPQVIHFLFFGVIYKWVNLEGFLRQESVCKMNNRESLPSASPVHHITRVLHLRPENSKGIEGKVLFPYSCGYTAGLMYPREA